MTVRFPIFVLVLAGLSGCGPSYSPDTYASNAAQQANKVEQGIIVGVRNVAVSAAGTVGAVTGGAAGGIAGAQLGVGPVSAFTALGGSLVGGLGGSAVEHVTADTTAFEYIVRKPNGDLVSVTQKDKTPLVLGQKVLVIAGTQARVVPDYTVPAVAVAAKPGDAVKADGVAPDAKPGDTKPGDAKPGDASAAASSAGAQPAASGSVAIGPAAAGDAKPAGQTGGAPPPPAASSGGDSAAASQAGPSPAGSAPASSGNPAVAAKPASSATP